MLQLVNFSNSRYDMKMLHNDTGKLQTFLAKHQLDGVELMMCEPWTLENKGLKAFAKGVHLKFWPFWLDFWREDQQALLRQFGSETQIVSYYEAENRWQWLELYKENVRMAVELGVEYLVFHVSNTRKEEVFTWDFHAQDAEVVEAAIEVLNELTPLIPEHTAILFENLWWPGLTLLNAELVEKLLSKVNHKNTGIMLDTGHLMHTNPFLRSQEEGVQYILDTLAQLGEHQQRIKGVHLHHSLAGEYIQGCSREVPHDCSLLKVLEHVMNIDKHLPFSHPAAGKILERIQPEYLIHEFIYDSLESWSAKVCLQQQILAKKVIQAEDIA